MSRLWTPTRLTQLRHHPSLQSITLMFANYVYDMYIIRSIFTHCPDTLQEFKITTFGGTILQSNAREEYWDEEKGMGLWRVLPQMRDLTIDMSLSPCEESILFPLLRSCPNLKRLRLNTMYESSMDSLMSVLLQAQLRKSVVQLELPNTLPTPARGVQVMDTFCGLTSLAMRVTAGDADVIAKMIECSGRTLQDIRLIEGIAGSRYVAGIDSILEKCCRLRTLQVDGLGNASGTGISMTRLLQSDPWACKETLEELAFRIDGLRNEDFDNWNEERGVLLIVRLFERLKELPRLRRLKLMWGGGATGLWKGIPYDTGVRVLEAHGRGMIMSDVEWMGLYWA
ncbi:hypothetical protein EC991_003670 [Linnemannia zychae]|nr:hypothetical protein EC991_003670 [Linnemannia zychae]